MCCFHCHMPIRLSEVQDSRDANMGQPHCWDCIDLAVWGAACPDCGEVPNGQRCPR